MNKGNITNIIRILKQYYSDIWTLWKGLDVQNQDYKSGDRNNMTKYDNTLKH